MALEQRETTGFLRLVGRGCVIELQGECGTCCSGRSIDCLVVSKKIRHCVRNVRADKSAPWSAHVAIAFDVLQKPPQIRTWQLISLSPLIPHISSYNGEEWLKKLRLVENAVPSKLAARSGRLPIARACAGRLPRAILAVFQVVASERHLKPQCQPEGSARCGGWSRREASSRFSD